jgi:hypothetical protein
VTASRLRLDAERLAAYRLERERARTAASSGDRAASWEHLERAHVLAQPAPLAHVGSHVAMLAYAVRTSDRAEVVGQVVRVLVAGPASLVGRIPVGNTGRADVPLRQHMAVPDDLAPLVGSG